MENLLEPQFICLMNRNEKKLIVMHWVGKTVLQCNQILNAQVFIVREGRIVTH
jgi:hypothetical protein